MLKRIISLSVALVLCLSVCFALPVSAANASEQQLVYDLGIMPERDGYGLVSKGFTRASFAHVLATMNQAEYAGEITKESMSAVAPDIMRHVMWGRNGDEYYIYINDYTLASDMMYAATSGYMSVDEEGLFHPTESISKNEALISLVKLLGYDIMVEANGGGDEAYLEQAVKIGLLKGVKIADESKLSYDDVWKIVTNAMGAPLLAYESVQGTPSCLWEQWGLSVGTGVIEANSNMGIGVSKAGANRVRIDGTTYYSRVEIPDTFVGSKATYYTVEGDHGKEVVSLYVRNMEEMITLDADEIDSVSDKGGYLEIIDENEDKILVDKQGYLMLNGKVQTPSKALFDLFDSGNATFIDTDEDGYYDVINMTFLYQVVVEGVNAEGTSLRTKFEKQLLDFSDTDALEVYNGNKAADFSNIKVDMAVGIACDAYTLRGNTITWDFDNAEYVKIYISQLSQVGMVDSIASDGTFSIEGVKGEYGSVYERLIDGGYLSELKVGFYVKAVYDSDGKLAYYEMATGDQAMSYGYVIAGGVEGGSIDRTTMLKILKTDGTFSEYATSPKFILDGALVETGSTTYSVNATNDVDLGKRQVIRYRVIDGVVREIDTAVVRGTAEDAASSLDAALAFDPASENGTTRTLTYGVIARKNAFTPNAVCFIDEAPISAVNPEERLFSVSKASSLADGDYYMAGFDTNEYYEMACAVRYTAYGASETASDSKACIYVDDYVGYVVGDIWRTVDANGEPSWLINVAGGKSGEQLELVVPLNGLELYSIDVEVGPEYTTELPTKEYFWVYRQEASQLESVVKSGDIVRFKTNTQGEVTYLEKMYDFASHHTNPYGNNFGFFDDDDDTKLTTSFGHVVLEKTSGNNMIYSYGSEGDGTTYLGRHNTKHKQVPVYYVKTGKVGLLPFAEIPSAATGSKVNVFIRYYVDKIQDNIFYIYE